MKAVLSTSIACSLVSLLGLLGLSVMTVAPGAEGWHLGMTLLTGGSLAAWLRLAFWARARLRPSVAGPGMSQRLKNVVVIGGLAYILFVLLCSVG